MSRPFQKLIGEGKDPGKINAVLLQDGEKYYILGTFAYTGHRIIFFPGAINRTITIHDGQSLTNQGSISILEHLTLETNLKDWHYKTANTLNRFPTNHTKEVEKNTVLWFVWRINDVKALEPVPKTTTMNFSVKESDTERRSKLFQQSFDGVIHHIVKQDAKASREFFWNIEFFVTTKKEKLDPDVPVNLSGNDTKLNESSKKGHTRIHHIRLVGFDGWIIIRVSKVKGSLSSNYMQFISGESL